MSVTGYVSAVGSKCKNRKLGFYHGFANTEELKSYELKKFNDQNFLIFYRNSGNTGNLPVEIENVDSEKIAHILNSIFWHLVQLFVTKLFPEIIL